MEIYSNDSYYINIAMKFYGKHIENLDFDKQCKFIDNVLTKSFVIKALQENTGENKILFKFMRQYSNKDFTNYVINKILSVRDNFDNYKSEKHNMIIYRIFNTINSLSLSNNNYKIITPDYIDKLPYDSLLHYSQLLFLKLNNINDEDEIKNIKLKIYINNIADYHFNNLKFKKLHDKSDKLQLHDVSNISKYEIKTNNIIQFIFLSNSYDINFIANKFLLNLIEKNKTRNFEIILNSFTNENKVLTMNEYYDYIKNYTYCEKEVMRPEKIEMEDFYNCNSISIDMKKLFSETAISNIFSLPMKTESNFLKIIHLTKNVHNYNVNFFKEQLEKLNSNRFNTLKTEIERLELLKINKNNNKGVVKKI